MAERQVATLEELREFAGSVVASLARKNTASVIGLSGDLGAGKTAFVKELASLLEVKEEVTSPTFVLMRSYTPSPDHQFHTLTHVDAYRVESDDEMRVLKFEELLRDPGQLICIEWPEHIQDLLPEDTYHIRFDITDGGTRTITYG